MLSTPTPPRTTTFRFVAQSMTGLRTFVRERTTMASYGAIFSSSIFGRDLVVDVDFQPGLPHAFDRPRRNGIAD